MWLILSKTNQYRRQIWKTARQYCGYCEKMESAFWRTLQHPNPVDKS